MEEELKKIDWSKIPYLSSDRCYQEETYENDLLSRLWTWMFGKFENRRENRRKLNAFRNIFGIPLKGDFRYFHLYFHPLEPLWCGILSFDNNTDWQQVLSWLGNIQISNSAYYEGYRTFGCFEVLIVVNPTKREIYYLRQYLWGERNDIPWSFHLVVAENVLLGKYERFPMYYLQDIANMRHHIMI